MARFKQEILKLWDLISKPEMRILPGQLAFFLVLSVAPIATVVGAIASLFSVSVDTVIDMLQSAVPKEVSDLVIPIMSGKGIDVNIVFYMVMGFIVASNGAHSIIVASNQVFDFEDSAYIRRRIKALFLTTILIVLFFFIMIVLAFGNTILRAILDIGVLKNIQHAVFVLFLWLKWPIAFLFIFFFVKILYFMAPDQHVPSKFMNKGAIFTTFSWSLVTAIYSYYVTHFSHYDIFYGSLSGFVVLMFWIYIISYLLVIGIAINASEYQLVKSDSVK